MILVITIPAISMKVGASYVKEKLVSRTFVKFSVKGLLIYVMLKDQVYAYIQNYDKIKVLEKIGN